MPLLRILLNIFLLFVFREQANGQQPLLRHYTVQDGLPSNVVYDVYQDSKGFVWLGTDQGVSRFDGNEFHNFSVEDGLPDNEVFRVREDGDQRCWLICYNHKACYLKDGKVYHSGNDELCRKVEQAGIRYDELYRFRDGSYGLMGTPIGLLTEKPPFFRVIRKPQIGDFRAFYFQADGEEYLLAGLNLNNLTTQRICLSASRMITEALFDGEYLFLFKPLLINHILEQWKISKNEIRLVKQITIPERIYQMNMLRPGQILCSTNDGLFVYDIAIGKLRRDNDFPLREHCNRALKDREGNWWLSTLNDGVYFKPANSASIIDRRSGLAGNNILSIAVTKDGKLITGDDMGRVHLLDRKSIKSFSVNQTGSSNRILFIKAINPETLMVGSDVGLFHIDCRSGIANVIYYQAFKAVAQYGASLFLGNTGGVITYDTISTKVSKIIDQRVTALETDHNGALWVGRLKGVDYYKEGKLYTYTHSPELNESRITGIVRSKEGHIVVGTNGRGLFIIKNENLPAIRLTRSDGLSGNSYKRLFAAKDGSIWACSEKGLDRLSPDGKGHYKVRPFLLPDVVSGNSINDLVEDNGKLFLGTIEGVVILDSRDTATLKPPRLYIDAVNNRAISRQASKQDLKFPYSERNIQVAYTGISFAGGSGLQYKYLLKGGSKDTLFTSAKTINFSALSPGRYELLLWVRSPRSAWTRQPATAVFYILPPFWLHPVFLAGAILLLVTAILLLYKARVNVIRQRAGRAARNKQQLAELEMKALRAQINPHFIFNALNSIQSYYSQNDELKANYYMTSFARFIRLTLMHSQSHWLPLSEEIAMLRTYVELEQMRFKQLFTFTLEVAPDINPEKLIVPAMLIQPYVENAINHGLRYLEGRKGTLALRFRIEDNHLCCVVEDNGIGRQQAEALKSQEHTSFGMKINRQRMDAINRMYDITIKAEVVDKQPSGTDSGGTLIMLLIPLKKQITYADHTVSR